MALMCVDDEQSLECCEPGRRCASAILDRMYQVSFTHAISAMNRPIRFAVVKIATDSEKPRVNKQATRIRWASVGVSYNVTAAAQGASVEKTVPIAIEARRSLRFVRHNEFFRFVARDESRPRRREVVPHLGQYHLYKKLSEAIVIIRGHGSKIVAMTSPWEAFAVFEEFVPAPGQPDPILDLSQFVIARST